MHYNRIQLKRKEKEKNDAHASQKLTYLLTNPNPKPLASTIVMCRCLN